MCFIFILVWFATVGWTWNDYNIENAIQNVRCRYLFVLFTCYTKMCAEYCRSAVNWYIWRRMGAYRCVAFAFAHLRMLTDLLNIWMPTTYQAPGISYYYKLYIWYIQDTLDDTISGSTVAAGGYHGCRRRPWLSNGRLAFPCMLRTRAICSELDVQLP